MPADPAAEPLEFPEEYGRSEVQLEWSGVRERLAGALRYWLATVRPDGRPHAVPLDGLWVDDAFFFGGSPSAVKHRNLSANPRAVLHLEDGDRAVIVEGACEVIVPDAELAGRLAKLSNAKYGYGVDASRYAQGVWRLAPVRALSWEQFPRDATRFVFEPARR
jgi:nitroimidazol reductase NimA-like FMN-containing flavoprotein (pyridoxamine 5'-phosphate oxidase superfamily)